jgi:ABC-type multidrug transport system ATPase subunit
MVPRTLSDGEQHLAYLARVLGASVGTKDVVCLDEFTSGLDRNLAKLVCDGLSNYILKHELPPATGFPGFPLFFLELF